MASGTLYTYPENFRAYKALIAAQYSGASLKVAENFVFGTTNKTAEFLSKFPTGKVPAFEASNGVYLTDSNAIAYYVANQQLRGNTDYEKAQVLQWIGFAEGEILPAMCAWVFPFLGIIQYNKVSVTRAKEDIQEVLQILNKHLLTRTYLVGERISLADIVVATTLLQLYQYTLDPQFRKEYVNTNRWFTTIVNQPQVKAVIGEVKLADKEAEIDPKKFVAAQSKPDKKEDKKEKKEKAGKQKKEKQDGAGDKKAKAEREAAEEEPDATELALAEEPKSKDPFAAYPKGTFDMDDFKRFYSNQDEAVAIPYFWEKFDPENYSIWIGEYKYNDELTKVFMSCNLISGMFQRLDKMRKNAFASACLFGEDNNSTISGVWVWKGHDLAFTLSPDWQVDYESYNWTKLDPTAQSTKDLVAQYFSWTGTDKEGRKFNQGKIFK